MTPPEDLFSRAVLGSLLVFGVVTLAYFRLCGQSAKVAVARRLWIILPTAGVASVSASIAFDMPLAGKVLCWLLGAFVASSFLFALYANRRLRSALNAKPKT